MIKFKKFMTEGVDDPAIFKAVFLAGGPGSGKSFIVGKTGLPALGLKVINSDDAYEAAMKKAGMEMSSDNIFSVKGQEIRGRAKALTGKKQARYLKGRLGVVVDGTGKDFAKIKKQVDDLRAIGYAVAMIFVNTDMDTALERNNARSRSLPDEMVVKMWKEVQRNLGKFQNLFRDRMMILDNSTGSNIDGATLSVYRKIVTWTKGKPDNRIAAKWIKDQKASK